MLQDILIQIDTFKVCCSTVKNLGG